MASQDAEETTTVYYSAPTYRFTISIFIRSEND